LLSLSRTDFGAAPQQDPAEGRKGNPNQEKDRQDGFRGQDGLPGLETLLLESGICVQFFFFFFLTREIDHQDPRIFFCDGMDGVGLRMDIGC
jgi:hypothetical protein